MKKIRYAVVGAGWISQEAFMPGVSQTENSNISAIVSGSIDKARMLADFHTVPHVYSYEQYDEMLAADVCDAVYVALPNSMHADFTIRAARAGKHILVEKPLATSLEDGTAMVAAAEENGVFLVTAYRLHNEQGTVDVLERIRAGEIGDPRIFSAVFSFMPDPDNHRLKAGHWGGPLQDVGVYCLNAVRHVFGEEPVEVTAVRSHGDNNPMFSDVEESIAVTLSFPHGRLAQFIASFGANSKDCYTVVGTKGSLTLDPAFRFETPTTLQRRNDDSFAFETFMHTDHFAGQVSYFSDCIVNGTLPEPDGGEGLADMRALLAIEKAAETGQAQKIDTPPRPSHPDRSMVRAFPTTKKRLLL
ncbi:Gfo/Idh/MocA family protein [Primorskyibacter flagellatus]|uniref:Predicted dehydrogenase n=1 Tax=Primorskyibacter flagellatus TaxID=1387277 RepID=A0A1W2EAR5_9RHOB|nr:Gfo/Idh/MocA family oxidoreductase [Primorskyibacter flagellatus]SMD06436.1 Predicted dehydrogenase [Primorskyibacter flagellatus]